MQYEAERLSKSYPEWQYLQHNSLRLCAMFKSTATPNNKTDLPQGQRGRKVFAFGEDISSFTLPRERAEVEKTDM